MSEQLIISVSREFGSGGHEIAQKLADHYGIPLLDKELLQQVALEKQVDVEELEELDELGKRVGRSRTVWDMNSSLEENIAHLQFDYLRRRAANGDSFVVVGRCSEAVLKDYEGLITIFVFGNRKQKVDRIKERYQVSEVEAKKRIRETDTERKYYHDSYCKGKWGEAKNYDISINSSKTETDVTVKFLSGYVDLRRKR